MRVTLAGATGLVGGLLLQRLRADPALREIHLVGRRAPAGVGQDAREVFHAVDFARLPAGAPWSGVERAYCCLGTTLRAAGSAAAFRALDHDAVLAFAHALRAAGTPELRIISSAGADPSARALYLRVKGEAERDLAALGFPRLLIFRPGLLRGPRAEFRPAERFALATRWLWEPLLRGNRRGLRTTLATDLATALHEAPATPGVSHWPSGADGSPLQPRK